MDAQAAEIPSFAGSLALSFVSLGLVCLLAYGVLRWLGRRHIGRGLGPLRVVARCSLEPRRSVYLVSAGSRCFLVGVGDGPMSLLAEIDPKDMPENAPESGVNAKTRFADVLSRVVSRPQ
jgi:flagellar biosynthetic protein FliO